MSGTCFCAVVPPPVFCLKRICSQLPPAVWIMRASASFIVNKCRACATVMSCGAEGGLVSVTGGAKVRGSSSVLMEENNKFGFRALSALDTAAGVVL